MGRVLISSELDDAFKKIKRRVLPRASSDRFPILLECGDRSKSKSHFKFKNMWLHATGFAELVDE